MQCFSDVNSFVVGLMFNSVFVLVSSCIFMVARQISLSISNDESCHKPLLSFCRHRWLANISNFLWKELQSETTHANYFILSVGLRPCNNSIELNIFKPTKYPRSRRKILIVNMYLFFHFNNCLYKCGFSLRRSAYAWNVRLYYPYRQYNNLFIFRRCVSEHCLPRTLRLFQYPQPISFQETLNCLGTNKLSNFQVRFEKVLTLVWINSDPSKLALQRSHSFTLLLT